jgi:hypothetical protein
LSDTEWSTLRPAIPQHFFVPKDFDLEVEHKAMRSIEGVFTTWQNGLKTDRDALFLDLDRKTLIERMKKLYSDEGVEAGFVEAYDVRDSSSYDLLNRRKSTTFDAGNVVKCLYRPFDEYWLYYARGLTSRPAWKVMQHVLAGRNLGLVFMRQVATGEGYSHFLATRRPVDNRGFYSNKGITCLAPLYLAGAPKSEPLFADIGSSSARQSNLAPEFTAEMGQKLGLAFVPDGKGDLKKSFGPEDVFSYIYAIFHSPTYRKRYAEFLKIDFPRVPLTSDKALFRKLCALGGELVALHLMESPKLDKLVTKYPKKGSDTVENVRYLEPGLPLTSILSPQAGRGSKRDSLSGPGAGEGKGEVGERKSNGRIYINRDQYFAGIRPEEWEFHIGGYQVLQKWLKDRKGRKLSADDLTHYQRIVIALRETIRLMAEIDQAIPKWPIG